MAALHDFSPAYRPGSLTQSAGRCLPFIDPLELFCPGDCTLLCPKVFACASSLDVTLFHISNIRCVYIIVFVGVVARRRSKNKKTEREFNLSLDVVVGVWFMFLFGLCSFQLLHEKRKKTEFGLVECVYTACSCCTKCSCSCCCFKFD